MLSFCEIFIKPFHLKRLPLQQKEMNHDVSKFFPQGSSTEENQENSRIKEVANELYRRCQLHEAQFRDSQEHVNRLDIEQREAECMAKEQSFWVPMDDVFKIGIPGPSGNENDTYVSNDYIYKVNNLLNSGSIHALLHKILLHNLIFPETAYTFFGFTGYENRSIMPIIRQSLIKDSTPATNIEIETYMAAIGFMKTKADGCFENPQFIVWDIVPRNVLKDKDGDIYIIDAEIKRK